MSGATIASVAQTLATILAGGGFVALITAFSRKRQIKIDVASRINEMSLKWAEDIQEEADESRKQAREVRAEMEALHRRMQLMQHEFDDLTRKFRILRNAIFMPDITVEDLRALVTGYANGIHSDDHP